MLKDIHEDGDNMENLLWILFIGTGIMAIFYTTRVLVEIIIF